MLKSIIKKAIQFKRSLDSQQINKKLVGQDKIGNKYYVIIDENGNEKKREVQYNGFFDEQKIDPLWNE